MLCPVYGHELTPLSCPPHQGVSFRSFKGLIILSPYTGPMAFIFCMPLLRIKTHCSILCLRQLHAENFGPVSESGLF